MITKGGSVELIGISRKFGRTIALQNFSLSVEPGELVTLLGPSGSGKTTALRIIAGIEKADTGIIKIDDNDVSNAPAHKRNIGMVFQAYSLFPNMTVANNISYGLRLRRVAPAQRHKRTQELLELIGMTEQASRRPEQLSGGQQQRVALARAIAFEPQVLLLDEPLSALDTQIRSQLRDEIRAIQRNVGTTTIFVTHDQEEAMAISDRVGVLNYGVLEQLDKPQALYNNPKSTFVASFVGLTNRVPALVKSSTKIRVLNETMKIDKNSLHYPPGTEVIALIRPESISFSHGDSKNQIISKSFLGSITKFGVDGGFGKELIVEINSRDAKGFDTGDWVDLHFHADSVMIDLP